MNAKVRRVVVCLSLSVLICMASLRSTKAQINPDCDHQGCFKNSVVPAGSGGQDARGRPIINIRIDNTFGNQTPANIWNGINGCKTPGCTGPGNNAVDKWNAQTDSPYGFQVSQDGQPIDVTVSRSDKDFGDCSTTTVKGPKSKGPARIVLAPQSVNWSSDVVACILAHELGHVLGLDDVAPKCPSSIMQGNPNKYPACSCMSTSITPTDVSTVITKLKADLAGPGAPTCKVPLDDNLLVPFGNVGSTPCALGDPTCCDPVTDPSCTCDPSTNPSCGCDPATDPSCGDPCTDPNDTSCGTGCVVVDGAGMCPPGYTFDPDPAICDCELDGTGCTYVEGQCDDTYQTWDDVACRCVDFQPPPDPWDECTLDWDFCY